MEQREKKRDIVRALGAGLIVLTTVSCGTSRLSSTSLDSSEWKLIRMNSEEKSEFTAENSFTLRFSTSDSTISGTAACNHYFGKYTTKGKKQIDIRTAGSTRMACPDMNLEQPFFAMLDQADGYKLENNRLILFTQKKESSVFERKTGTDMHSAENSLDYVGKYEGTIPSTEGPEIKTVLELHSDNRCFISRTYPDRQSVSTENGTYVLNENLLTVKLNQTIEYYSLGENHLRQLNQQQKEITGPLASRYILKKTENR